MEQEPKPKYVALCKGHGVFMSFDDPLYLASNVADHIDLHGWACGEWEIIPNDDELIKAFLPKKEDAS